MTVPDPNLNSRSGTLGWAGLLVLLYVLSIGPVVKLAIANKIPLDAIETIYAPLVWLCETPVGGKVLMPGLVWYGETIWRWGLPYYK